MKAIHFSLLILRLFSLGVLVFGGLLRANALDASSFASDDIVAWWPLQGNGNDVSGRNHPLTIEGQPLFGDGEVGQAMVLDGGNDYGHVAAHPDLDLGANDALTIELWISPANTSPPQSLLEWTDNNSIVGLHFWMSVVSPWAGGGPRSLFANVIDRNGVAHHVSSAPGVIASNAFTHVAFTYSKISGLAKLYANGQVVATTNIGSVTPETRTALYAGWRPLGGGQYRFAGKLDEITLYSRELSQAELNSIFQSGPAGKTPTTNPPPPVASDFNVGRDFSAASNPSGAWSYGWKANLGGAYSNLTVRHASGTDNGLVIPSWQLTSFQTPAVYCNTGSVTASFGGGAGQAEPGAVWYYPGENGRPENYGVIRFTAPSNGNYRIAATVRPVYDGPPQGDTDFHVLKNGAELFGQFLSPTQRAGFTGVVALAANEVVDLAIGRGADGSQYGSGLKIAAMITPTSTASVSSPHDVVADGSFQFTVIGNGSQLVECSSNLVDWFEAQLPILTNNAGRMIISDPQAASLPKRFYRVRALTQ